MRKLGIADGLANFLPAAAQRFKIIVIDARDLFSNERFEVVCPQKVPLHFRGDSKAGRNIHTER